MKSAAHGNNTSAAEVVHITPHGFWLSVHGEELFAPFAEFPWFKAATVEQICAVELPSPQHLYWPTLDVDLSVESIRSPEKFPLRAAVPPIARNG